MESRYRLIISVPRPHIPTPIGSPNSRIYDTVARQVHEAFDGFRWHMGRRLRGPQNALSGTGGTVRAVKH